ncbi:C4-dicarboxylate ABC transporter permease [Caldovatus sediminis]|uniref:TRAP transporter large permease protein n=1 Tax=Caldovatus sediminis TaxID=2041189 RepID=A0A8J2ZCL7_9PROT|nr:TRAP transporter large permease subunit [Caldovatus sediminis]GGG37362.1 C4-dicarboxylate ABC transporter permease [Caldovatus sediminis]
MTAAVGVAFVALLVLGVPIWLVLGISATALFALEAQPLVGLAQKVMDELNSATLLAVPYFVAAAVFMERGNVARALIGAAEAWVGSVRGGLGLVCVVSCTIFAAMCGSSVATAMAMGTILVPAMLRAGYERHFAAGIIAASGTLGILIPPSLAFVVYGVLADEAIPRLFLAGVIPGLMQAGLIAGWILFYARRKGYGRQEGLPLEEKIRRTVHALPALSVPVIVLGGLYGGLVTVTESAALSAVVAMLLSVFVYRGVAARDFLAVLAEAIRNAAAIMIIIAVALVFGHWVTETGVARRAAEFVTEQGITWWQFLIVVNVALLFLGMFLEVFSVLLLTMPVVVPMLEPLGINPVHFGVVMVMNMELALLTPPVGLNLFVIASIARAPLSEVVRGTLPFLLLQLGLLVLITYVPMLSLWLVSLFYG